MPQRIKHSMCSTAKFRIWWESVGNEGSLWLKCILIVMFWYFDRDMCKLMIALGLLRSPCFHWDCCSMNLVKFSCFCISPHNKIDSTGDRSVREWIGWSCPYSKDCIQAAEVEKSFRPFVGEGTTSPNRPLVARLTRHIVTKRPSFARAIQKRCLGPCGKLVSSELHIQTRKINHIDFSCLIVFKVKLQGSTFPRSP